jgi:hypothetical protein
VYTQIFGQLWMKRGDKLIPLPGSHNFAVCFFVLYFEIIIKRELQAFPIRESFLFYAGIPRYHFCA